MGHFKSVLHSFPNSKRLKVKETEKLSLCIVAIPTRKKSELSRSLGRWQVLRISVLSLCNKLFKNSNRH